MDMVLDKRSSQPFEVEQTVRHASPRKVAGSSSYEQAELPKIRQPPNGRLSDAPICPASAVFRA